MRAGGRGSARGMAVGWVGVGSVGLGFCGDDCVRVAHFMAEEEKAREHERTIWHSGDANLAGFGREVSVLYLRIAQDFEGCVETRVWKYMGLFGTIRTGFRKG